MLYLGTKLTKVRGKAGQWQINSSEYDSARMSNHDFPHKFDNESAKSNLESSRYDTIDFGDILHPREIACLVVQTNYNTQRGKYLRAVRYQKKPVLNFTK